MRNIERPFSTPAPRLLTGLPTSADQIVPVLGSRLVVAPGAASDDVSDDAFASFWQDASDASPSSLFLSPKFSSIGVHVTGKRSWDAMEMNEAGDGPDAKRPRFELVH